MPRADEPLRTPICLVRERRGRGGPARLTYPVLASLVFHAVVAVGLVLWLGRPAPVDPVGVSVQIALVADLCDRDASVCPELPDTPLPDEVFPEIPEPRLPEETMLPEPPVPLEYDLLEPIDEPLSPVAVPELSLAVVAARRPAKVMPVTPPPAEAPPVIQRPPVAAPTPVAARVVSPPRPAARRSRLPVGRLRPLVRPRHYPERARQLGLEGVARVEVLISAGGAVVSARLVVSAGHALLDQAAVESARQWRFAPPGAPRRARLPFRYTLR